MPYNNKTPFVAGSKTSEEAAKSLYSGPTGYPFTICPSCARLALLKEAKEGGA
jgi:hypothetical protein